MTRRTRKPSICDAPGCDVVIPRGRLMCRSHWFQVPRQLREAINETWRSKAIRAWSANCLEARSFLARQARAAAESADA